MNEADSPASVSDSLCPPSFAPIILGGTHPLVLSTPFLLLSSLFLAPSLLTSSAPYVVGGAHFPSSCPHPALSPSVFSPLLSPSLSPPKIVPIFFLPLAIHLQTRKQKKKERGLEAQGDGKEKRRMTSWKEKKSTHILCILFVTRFCLELLHL